ncbi:MAG: cell wall-binding protein [Herbinix sp.]|nr:cell wall-binding protein [Herbinix sp.]
MKKLIKAIVIVFMGIMLALPVTNLSMASNTMIAEAATKRPSLEEDDKILYLGDTDYQIPLLNVSKSATVTYISRNTKVAKVSKSGKVTTLSAGNANIVIKVIQSSKTYQLNYLIKVKKPYIEYQISVDYINVSETFTFKAKAFGTTEKIKWSVSDPTIATISAKGVLKAIGSGTVSVYAKAGKLTKALEVSIGTNRIRTLNKDITIYEDETIWITLSDLIDDEALHAVGSDGNVFDFEWGEWEGNRIPINITAYGVGKGTLTITSIKSNDRLVININVINEPNKLSAVEIYEKCGPATVEIKVSDDYAEALGSGFFIADGMVVTNYHVIRGANKIQVTANDNVIYNVQTILGYDEKLDIAILKVDVKNTGLTISQNNVKVGEVIYTLGSPLGLTGTMTDGMVTTASRIIDTVDYIQINASISQGNSGGPLVNTRGEVIGINTMYFVDGQNVNFAINIHEVEKVLLNKAINVDDYYAQYQKQLEEDFKENLIYEDTNKSKSVNDCQYIPPYNGVVGTIATGEKWDLYWFEVTEPGWLVGNFVFKSQAEVINTYIELYDATGKSLFIATENLEELYQYIRCYLNPGQYTISIYLKDGYSGPDVPYLFTLLYN